MQQGASLFMWVGWLRQGWQLTEQRVLLRRLRRLRRSKRHISLTPACCPACCPVDSPQKQKVDLSQQQAAAAAAPGSKKTKSGLEIEQHTSTVSGIMSATTFDSLELSGPTAQGIADMQFSHMTEVQVRREWRGSGGGAGYVIGWLAGARGVGTGGCRVGGCLDVGVQGGLCGSR